MSPDLIAFLKAWYDWATNGAPEGEPFRRQHGLCAGAIRFGGILVEYELTRLLGRRAFPFGAGNYIGGFAASTQHECPKRLAWVRDRLIEAGEPVS